MTYIVPALLLSSFTCPQCNAIAHQEWRQFSWGGAVYAAPHKNPLAVSTCSHCNGNTFWVNDKMYYPSTGNAPPANSEMPAEVAELYREASDIFGRSPRAAAALLRLAIQVLCQTLGEPGQNINKDIAALVSKGLPSIVQQSLDVVRVTGNNAVHPGQIDADDPVVVSSLFQLVNIVVEYMIAMPKRVSGLYGGLPAESLAAIQNRDGRKV
jgi:hypothetical protein